MDGYLPHGDTYGSEHGGPDALGVPRFDFSTNANACGPAPMLLAALADADPAHYPDPTGRALREVLAVRHGVTPERIVLAASASEFIRRLTTLVALARPGTPVQVPQPAYGDYARAAQACGLPVRSIPWTATAADVAALRWHTEPSSPRGGSMLLQDLPDAWLTVIDCAYAPLRLEGAAPALPPQAWQLWSPNKALGLTGVRGAYAVAPPITDRVDQPWPVAWLLERLQALAPSWPLGAHGVAMLHGWTQLRTQVWLHTSLQTLRGWKERQLALLDQLGWQCGPSVAPFFVARHRSWSQPAASADTSPEIAADLAALRLHGIKLRDTTSMGLPGYVRISVQPPEAQGALARVWRLIHPEC